MDTIFVTGAGMSDPNDTQGAGERIEPAIGNVDHEEVVVVERRGASFAGSPQQRWAWIIGSVLTVAFLAIIGYSYMRAKPNTDRASIEAPRAKGSGAVEDPTPRQRELVIEENQRAAEEAMRDPRGVETPPFLGASERVPPPAAPPPPSYPVQMQRPAPAPQIGSSVDYISQLAAAAGTVRSLTRLPLGHTTAFANDVMQPPAPVETPVPPGGLFAVGEYLTARLDMGINSDFSSEVTAVILRPDAYRGIRLVGRFDQPNERFARNRVALRFTEAYPDPYAEPIRLNAVAVEPGARVPALRGKVNYHVLENVVFHLGGAFVQGYASGLAATNLSTIAGTDGPLDSSIIVQSNLDPALSGAARAAQALVSPRGIRPPTVQIPAGTSIGVVVLSQQAASEPLPGTAPQAPPLSTDPVFVPAPLPTAMMQSP